jgi:putative addiction module component (TIGR02574 family)
MSAGMNAMTFDTLLDSALGLPLEQRSRLASRLIESVDADDAPLSPAWLAEIDRRMERAKSGEAKRVPHEEVMAEACRLVAAQSRANA